MATWEETYLDAFTEADVAKTTARDAFLAVSPPPITPAQVPAIADAMTKAFFQALLHHIGPVSSDNSIVIGTKASDDGVLQLDLKTQATVVKTPFGETTIAGNTIECLGHNEWLVSGSGLFNGIVIDPWGPGDILGLTFVDSPHVVHAATVPAGFAPFYLATKDGVGQDIRYDSVYGEPARTNGRIRVQLRTDAGISPSPCWQLIGASIS